MHQVPISICGKVWWWFEYLYSQLQWQLGGLREKGTVCSTFLSSSSTCNLYPQQSGIWAFWKVAVGSRVCVDCGKRRKAIINEMWGKSWNISVSEHWLSWIWGWILSKHVKSNWVGSFDFFFPFTPLNVWFYFFLTCFPYSLYGNKTGADTGNLQQILPNLASRYAYSSRFGFHSFCVCIQENCL